MRPYYFKYKIRKNRSRRLRLIKIVLYLALFLGVMSLILKIYVDHKVAEAVAVERVKIHSLENEVSYLKTQNKQLEINLKVATAESKPKKLSEQSINKLVQVLFPYAGQFKKILNCENSTHDPKKVHFNNDGSYDLGIAQINSYWHKQRVEKLFDEPFEVAMSDPVKNLVFAALKFKEEGINPWKASGGCQNGT